MTSYPRPIVERMLMETPTFPFRDLSMWFPENVVDDEKGYDPSQPRVPSGSSEGGQFASSGMGAQAFAAFGSKVNLREGKKIRVVTASGEEWVGKAVSRAMDGSSLFMQRRKGGKTECEVFKASNVAEISYADESKVSKPPKSKKKLENPPDVSQDIPTPPKSRLDEIDAAQLPYLEKHAKEAGVTVDELKEQWTGIVQESLTKAKVYVAMPPDVLGKVLQEGRYKSQFETNSSFGGDVQHEARSESEAYLFGTPPDTAPKDRPVYGYASQEPPNGKAKEVNNHTSCSGYGSVIVELHDKVKDRSTVTYGDSLNKQEYAQAMPYHKADHHIVDPSPDRFSQGVPKAIEKKSVDAVGAGNSDYTEVQIHNGLPLQDIKKVWLRKKPDADLEDLLNRRGIEWGLQGG